MSLKALFGLEKRVGEVATPDGKAAATKKRRLNKDGEAVARGVETPAKPAIAPPRVAPENGLVEEMAVASTTGAASFWSGPAGPNKKALASPAFDPSLRSDEFPAGKPIAFALLSGALKEIEDLKGSGQGSRKKSIVILSNLFRMIMHARPEDLVPTIYFLCNKVGPDYEESELGVGDTTIIRAMCEVFGRSEAQVKASLSSGEASDLGEVALLSRVAQKMLMAPPKLTIEKVFGELKGVAFASGKESQKVKKDKMKKMLVASRDEEAKYIVRTLQGKLRVGTHTQTLIQALAHAFVLTRPALEGAPALADVRTGAGKLSLTQLDARLSSMEAAVRQAYSELPNYDRLVGSLMAGHTAESLPTVCHISLGIPVKPMLAKPSKGLGEVTERLNGKRFTAEWKYDGERAQIHVLSRDEIQIYSRNSENMTEKYPDVIQVVQETLRDGVESCIIDSELVAFDQTSRRILPFQILTTRARKNVVVEDIKVNVCIFAFDAMLLNGTPMVKDDLETRRMVLQTRILNEVEGKVKFAVFKDWDELVEEEVQTFLDESIAGSCEGLMLKKLKEDASYEPSRRSLNWLKLKKDYLDGVGDSIDVVPIGAWFGKGKRTGAYGAYLLAVYSPEDEEYQTVCKAGTGFSDEDLSTHYNFLQQHTIAQPETNYNVSDKMQPEVWFEPKQVWEIKAADLSISPVHTAAFGVKANGKGIGLRFPRFLRIRPDKEPEDATASDQIVDMYNSQASVAKDGGADDVY